ncbi:MAG: hypothetical protein JOZ39_08525 [Chloroflexi bacterium]|nr:hypothetical protein [Chloroflexota bacterium]
MRLVFERGMEGSPKGHALIYFRDPDRPGVLATYVIVPPVAMDISKYLPPMFAGQGLNAAMFQAPQVVPLPPLPESVDSLAELERLAGARDDDLVYAGEASSSQVDVLMTSTAEAAQLYLHFYEDYARTLPEVPSAHHEEPAVNGPSAEELTFALMSEQERLGELAKMSGAIRYAIDGNDQRLADETLERMRLLAKHLAPKYWPDRIVRAAAAPRAEGGDLLQLYVERCYKLLEEDYPAVAQLDQRIKVASGEA